MSPACMGETIVPAHRGVCLCVFERVSSGQEYSILGTCMGVKVRINGSFNSLVCSYRSLLSGGY